MTHKEVIDTLEIVKAKVEWNYPMDYAIAIDQVVENIKKFDFVLCACKEKGKGVLRWNDNTASFRHTDTVLCSVCGKCYGDEYRYCPNCGAKMEG